jgi:hypothetical protein
MGRGRIFVKALRQWEKCVFLHRQRFPTNSPADPDTRPLEKRGRGNPNMKLQHAGVSLNPGGRRKLTDEEREWTRLASEKLEKDHPDNVDWLIAARNNEDAPWDVRARIALHLDNKKRPDPPRLIAAAAVSTEVRAEELDNLGALDKLSALYGAMIGAQSDEEAYRYSRLVDVTPSRSRLSPPIPTIEELRQITVEEVAEKAAAEQAAQRRERVVRPRIERPQRERVRRPR